MNPPEKLSICLFSDPNFLAVNILENLLSNNCVVNIVTNNVGGWEISTTHLPNRNRFSIVDSRKLNKGLLYDYAVFTGGFIKSKNGFADYNNFLSFPGIIDAKTIILFPLEIFDRSKSDSIKTSNNTAVIYLGDLIGPRINLESDLAISQSLSEIITKRTLSLGVGEMFYPVFVGDAARIIVKWLFSFGPYGKTTLLLGNQLSGDYFWNVNQKLVGQLRLKYDPNITARIIPKGFETKVINGDLNFSLTETYRWLSNNPQEKPKNNPKTVKIKKVKPTQTIKIPRKIKTTFLILFLIFAFPFVCLALSLFSSFIAYKNIIVGNHNLSVNSFLMAQTFATVSEKESQILSYIPGLGLVYKETSFASVFSREIDGAGIHLIPVITDTTQLMENILGTQIYDPVNLSEKIESEVGLLYNDVSDMKIEIESASSSGVILANKILTKVDLEKLVNLVSECKILAGNTPQILGQDKTKTYLLLFQNNMELRPTGGFIGSFGLLTFDKGRLTDLTVNDVYSADGQLNGHVEPPTPIRDYLGEANWWFRDSNWDPDFPTSAKRAEWFLDKELSKQVDGVVAVDLFPIKEILKSTGPVFLSDYNLNITSDNLYEETQSEVQNNFFPGTHQKASFLTTLSRNLLSEIVKLNPSQEINIVRSFYDGLDERHIQVYLHDSTSQVAVSALGWDGAVTLPACGTNCYADLIGVVEANVGDNKANYYIDRSFNLDLTINSSTIDRKLTINLTNVANTALGPSGKYKDYLRILIPADASLVSAKSITGSIEEALSPEIVDVKGHREVGVLTELLGGNSESIEFSWESKVTGALPLTGYGLYFRKEAGTDADQVSINIDANRIETTPDPRFALTKEGIYGYNTTLVRDLFTRFTWLPK